MVFSAKNCRLPLDGAHMDYVRFGAGSRTLIMIPGLGDGLRTVRGTALAMAWMEPLTVPCMLGLGTLPSAGWTLGTLCGALAGSVLPVNIRAALGVMLYGMFIAIVVPQAKEEKPIAWGVVLALGLSCLFAWVPGLNRISEGLRIVICTVAAAAFCAWKFPIEEDAA